MILFVLCHYLTNLASILFHCQKSADLGDLVKVLITNRTAFMNWSQLRQYCKSLFFVVHKRAQAVHLPRHATGGEFVPRHSHVARTGTQVIVSNKRLCYASLQYNVCSDCIRVKKNLRTQFVFRFAHISFERVDHSQSLPQMMLDDVASEVRKEVIKKKRRHKRRRSKQKIKKIIVHRFHRPSVTKIEDSEEEHTLDRLPGVDLETGI